MKIRLIEEKDINSVMEMINDAKVKMRDMGINQWQDGDPNENLIREYLKNKNGYTNEDVTVFGALILKDSDYNEYLSGDFATVHTFVVNKEKRRTGLATDFFNLLLLLAKKNGVKTIGVDTHKDNIIMLNFLKKQGFLELGDIIIGENKPRIAFKKEL